MSSSVKFVASLTLSFGLYMLYNATSLSSKMVRDVHSSSLMNNVLAIVRFVHFSFNCAHPQLAQCRIFFSAVKGKAVLHFLQERYVVSFSTPSAGQETVLSWLSISCSSFLCIVICVCAIADWRFSVMYLLSWKFLTIALVKL